MNPVNRASLGIQVVLPEGTLTVKYEKSGQLRRHRVDDCPLQDRAEAQFNPEGKIVVVYREK